MGIADPKRKAALNDAIDRVYQELNREVPAQVEMGSVAVSAVREMKAPALKP